MRIYSLQPAHVHLLKDGGALMKIESDDVIQNLWNPTIARTYMDIFRSPHFHQRILPVLLETQRHHFRWRDQQIVMAFFGSEYRGNDENMLFIRFLGRWQVWSISSKYNERNIQQKPNVEHTKKVPSQQQRNDVNVSSLFVRITCTGPCQENCESVASSRSSGLAVVGIFPFMAPVSL